jgi:CubicO group peptidase (beta-lactamase class C family)
MQLTRRTWLGGVAGLAGAAVVPVAARAATATIVAPGASPAFAAAIAALAEFASADLVAHGFPGMTLALRAADGQTATLAIGDAEVETHTPVRPDHLFQIGSISKSFVAMALFALAGQGKLDLDAPAVSIVPELWLEDRSITLAQIMAHSAGLPDNSPPFPDVPGGKLWSATPPGTHFSYSNAGYDMLAFVVERVSGLRYDRALTALVLGPLGLATAVPVIRTQDRARYPFGYVAYRGDVAWFPHARLAQGPWLDIDRAAGSVAATSADMLRYIAFLGRVAKGQGAPLFSDALAQRFATPVIATTDFGPGARYANGLATVDVDGKPTLHHTGGMLVFSSAVYVDRASGAGVFASVNIGGTDYRPRAVAQHGVRLLRAVAAGAALPPPPAIATVAPIAAAGDFAGRFVGPSGDTIVLAASGSTLSLVDGDRRGAVRAAGDGSFVSDLPGRDAHALDFVAAPGRRDQLWYGAALYGRDAAVAQPAVPPELAAFAGVYLANDPWIGGSEVIARGGTLVVEGDGPIHRVADGSWRFAAPQSTDRLWFDRPVGGRPQRLNLSGAIMLRFAG